MNELSLERPLQELRQLLERARSNQQTVPGMSTGFPTLDLKLGGLRNGELIVLGARPGQGKTALASQIAFHVARELRDKDQDGLVVFVSGEMHPTRMLQREIAHLTGISTLRQEQGQYDHLDQVHIEQALDDLGTLPILINKPDMMYISYVEELVRSQMSYGIALLVVDHLSLFYPEDPRENRYTTITKAIASLRQIRDKLNAPMLVLSQLRRPDDDKPLRRPRMEELRDSGMIEADANQVWLLFNPAAEIEGSAPGINPELLIPKNRDGYVGKIPLRFHGTEVHFEDVLATEAHRTPSAVEESLARFDPSRWETPLCSDEGSESVR